MGDEETKKTHKDDRGRKKAFLTRLRNSLVRFIAEENVGQVKLTLENLQTAFDKFEEIHELYHGLLETDDDIAVSDTYFFEAQNQYVESLNKGKEYLRNSSEESKTEKKPNVTSQSIDASSGLKDFASYMNLPKVELEIFSGDPLKYSSFLAIFDEHVHRAPIDDSMKLSRLLQYTSGKAKDAIRPYTLMDAKEGYRNARESLEKRFGNSHTISDLIIKQLKNGKQVRSPADLLLLSDDLHTHYATLESLGKLPEIDTQSCIVDIVNRMQPYIRNRWKRLAMEEKRNNDRYPKFKDLVQFIAKEADEANDPIYGSSLQSKQHPKSSASCMSSVVSNQTGYADKYRKRPCVVCKAEHHPFSCQKFRAMKPPDRLKFVRENKLCENCLMANHVTSDCRRATVCSVPGCGMKHTKFLHVSDEVSGQVSVNASVSQVAHTNVDDAKTVCLPVISVTVNDKCNTLALLDSASTNSFCTKKLIDSLGLKGTIKTYVLSTLSQSDEMKSAEVVNLHVNSCDQSNMIKLSQVYVVDKIPSSVPALSVDQYSHLSDLPLALANDEVQILIGQDNADALLPLEVRRGRPGEPFAVRTPLGWSLNGPVTTTRQIKQRVVNHFVSTSCQVEDEVNRLWSIENDVRGDKVGLSVEDKQVHDLWNREVNLIDGHYQLPIPFKESATFPDNFTVALSRLRLLRANLVRRGLLQRYDDEIAKLCFKGYAEKIPLYEIANDVSWYLPHQAVISDKKPGKLRVVFDCSSKFKGESLNDKCFRGPDFANKLLHVLLRFRNHRFAFTSDVEAMYYQVKIPPDHRDYLRFLWFSGDSIEHYRMLVHVFGGVWSGSAATYALRKVADDFNGSDLVLNTILNAFYIDDCLVSTPREDDAKLLITGVKELLSLAGFNLTKFVVNDECLRSVLTDDEQAVEVKELHVDSKSKALGVQWKVQSDVICFDVDVPLSVPVTRRIMLSTLSSLFDPLGLVAPVLMPGKILFQDATRLKLAWDESVPQRISDSWFGWLRSMGNLGDVEFARCVKPSEFDDASIELHHFSDASERAYGACSYIRCINKVGQIHTALLYSKGRVAPIKTVSIPRLELQAALLSARIDQMLREELHLHLAESSFWVDSEIVLKYIANETQRFKVFVSNRVGEIRSLTKPDQWGHISSPDNPADHITRGADPAKLQSVGWHDGPKFLRTYKENWNRGSFSGVLDFDEEVKPTKDSTQVSAVSCPIDVTEHPIDVLINYYSDWYSLKRALCYWLRFKNVLLNKGVDTGPLSVHEIAFAEQTIIKHVQQQFYGKELKQLSTDGVISKSSCIRDLLPMKDGIGLLRVGGRIKHASVCHDQKHPVIIPHSSPIAKLIAREVHCTGHLGVEWSLGILRTRYWITKARCLLKSVKRDCFVCRKLYDRSGSQRMADLPPQRLMPNEPAFSFVGTDCFGPFLVKVGRSQVKRYGCIFTCFTTRAVHIEILCSMDTDAFINALRRFVARRGNPVKIWSDNGTNMVGCHNELTRSLQKLNHSQLHGFCTKRGIDWIFNPPGAPHMGGVFERMIQSVKRVLNAILGNTRLNDEILCTVMCEVESVINSRPITRVSEDSCDLAALTPNHFLILSTGPSEVPGEFFSSDIFRRRWRHVQHLVDVFWSRWLKLYLPQLQRVSKWHNIQRNLKLGDLVLITDESTPRGLWPMGLVTKVRESRDGLVRTASVKTKATELVRPVTKLVLLEGDH